MAGEAGDGDEEVGGFLRDDDPVFHLEGLGFLEKLAGVLAIEAGAGAAGAVAVVDLVAAGDAVRMARASFSAVRVSLPVKTCCPTRRRASRT